MQRQHRRTHLGTFAALVLIAVGCGGSSTNDGGNSNGTAGTPDASVTGNGNADSAPPTPVSPGAGACGSTTCGAGEQCCVTTSGASCTPSGGCDGGIPLACTSAAACASGQVCCGTLGAGGGGASCSASCSGVQLCAGDSECPNQEPCTTVGSLKVCNPFGNFDGGFPGFDGGLPGFDAGLPDLDGSVPKLDGGFNFDAGASSG